MSVVDQRGVSFPEDLMEEKSGGGALEDKEKVDAGIFGKNFSHFSFPSQCSRYECHRRFHAPFPGLSLGRERRYFNFHRFRGNTNFPPVWNTRRVLCEISARARTNPEKGEPLRRESVSRCCANANGEIARFVETSRRGNDLVLSLHVSRPVTKRNKKITET